MLQYSLQLTNAKNECCIQIACSHTGEPIEGINKVLLKRRLQGNAIWTTIWEKEIATEADLSFTVLDANTKSHYTYEYMAIPVLNGMEQVGAYGIVKCSFDGIFVSDTTGRYICRINPSYTPPDSNVQFNAVATLGRKHPFIVQNGISDYLSGSVTGYFAPIPTNGQYNQEFLNSYEMREYRDRFHKFLKNGLPKTIKTFDGHGWYAYIKPTPKDAQSAYIGGADTTFEWIEIDDFPKSGVVVIA